MAKRQVFYSFHYDKDVWRASQVRNMGIVDGTRQLTDNEWEAVWQYGDYAISRWIDDQLRMRSCLVVLVGEDTSQRKWVRYEIKRAWELKKGIVGIRIHKLKDRNGIQSRMGASPFWGTMVNGITLYDKVRLYEPPFSISSFVYSDIRGKIEKLVDEAIENRKKYY